ncbi:hypothetical protein ACFY9C_14880 [Streptomyces filamentosus]|uniref:hypothetical protein n=1 Tax=Streptomyces filamentosus TaxID=67294 RepID=UPI0036EF2543
MDYVPDHVLRTLWYIDLMARYGNPLPWGDVDRYAQQAVPRDAHRKSPFGGLGEIIGRDGMVIHRPDPVAAYLKGVGWVLEDSGVAKLTPAGRTVLVACGEAADELAAEDPEVADVALDPQDPLVYVQLTRRLQKAGAGLLVDAYFKADSLVWLIESTNLRRVLISSRQPRSERDRQTIAVALATVPNGSDVEVRHTADPSLHDRCVIGEKGDVQLLGSSVNGVGKHLTAVITPSSDISQVYRKKYEALWGDAAKVEPRPMQA